MPTLFRNSGSIPADSNEKRTFFGVLLAKKGADIWSVRKKELTLQRFLRKQAIFEVEQEGEPLPALF